MGGRAACFALPVVAALLLAALVLVLGGGARAEGFAPAVRDPGAAGRPPAAAGGYGPAAAGVADAVCRWAGYSRPRGPGGAAGPGGELGAEAVGELADAVCRWAGYAKPTPDQLAAALTGVVGDLEAFAPTDAAFSGTGGSGGVRGAAEYVPRFNATEAADKAVDLAIDRAFGERAAERADPDLRRYLTERYLAWNGDTARLVRLADAISLIAGASQGSSPEERVVPLVVAAMRRGAEDNDVVQSVADWAEYDSERAMRRPDARTAVGPGLSMMKRPWAGAAESLYKGVAYGPDDEPYPVNSVTEFVDDGDRLASVGQAPGPSRPLEAEWPFRDRG